MFGTNPASNRYPGSRVHLSQSPFPRSRRFLAAYSRRTALCGRDRNMSSLHELLEALTPSRDRRLHTRTTLAALTYVELGDTRGGMVLNISEEGMALAVADKYVLGEYLSRIRFPLPISSESFEVSAQIVWLSESKNGAGIRFVDLTPDARDRISHWIKSEKPALEFEQLLKPLRREGLVTDVPVPQL